MMHYFCFIVLLWLYSTWFPFNFLTKFEKLYPSSSFEWNGELKRRENMTQWFFCFCHFALRNKPQWTKKNKNTKLKVCLKYLLMKKKRRSRSKKSFDGNRFRWDFYDISKNVMILDLFQETRKHWFSYLFGMQSPLK